MPSPNLPTPTCLDHPRAPQKATARRAQPPRSPRVQPPRSPRVPLQQTRQPSMPPPSPPHPHGRPRAHTQRRHRQRWVIEQLEIEN